MNISLNGDKREVPESLTITGLLDFLNIQHQRVAVELNLEIVKKDKYAATAIKEGDSLEVVSFMGGGSTSAECGVWNENEKSGVSAYERR
ncbi:MAG TPA: sulfur carrier protein ThiS [Nitrospirota bacterium]